MGIGSCWRSTAPWVVGGLLAGYLILSPLGMVFFHLSHHGLDPELIAGMHVSSWGAIRLAFASEVWLWGLSFAGLGAALGIGVGGVVRALQERRAESEARARALAEANAALEQAYRQVLQADKMATLGLLAGTVIHDLNNHLQKLLLAGQIELQLLPIAERQRSPWTAIRVHVQRMRALTESVRRFSRKSSAARARVNVDQALGEALLLMRQAIAHAGLQLREELFAGGAEVEANANELVQVVVNLLENAIDATPPGGSVRVASRRTAEGVELAVADTGAGIPSEQLALIFDAFFTTKPEERGTGLGLAICRQIVESHAGQLSVDSRVGLGTTFRVLLPLAAVAEACAPALQPARALSVEQALLPTP